MIQHFLITVLVIYGVHAVTEPGMVLGGMYQKFFYMLSRKMNDPSKILKPLFDCTPCMASIYGTISFFMFCDFPSPLFLSYGVWVFSLCGFNYILNKILNR